MTEQLLIEILPPQEAAPIKAGNAAAVQAINAIEEANREYCELINTENSTDYSVLEFSHLIEEKYAKRNEAIQKYLQIINE